MEKDRSRNDHYIETEEGINNNNSNIGNVDMSWFVPFVPISNRLHCIMVDTLHCCFIVAVD